MSTMKDKLAASVRQAKAAQQPAAKPAARPAPKRAVAAKPAAKPVAAKAAPAKTAAKPAAPKPAPAAAATAKSPAAQPSATRVHAGGIPDSNGTLHPQRVWPD
ncbi:MAG: hypothetical protein LDL19_09585 [Thiobacillus sp.]|nr:hypothetical protein [Thiobacillus sp.]